MSKWIIVEWNEEYAYVSGNPHLEAAIMGLITDDSSISIKFIIDGSEIRKS
jgi:hypothetical protein